ncbi:MAG TPA: hypothetical protein VIL32_02935 [Steroidobacteraceae bacterium]
MTVLYIDSALSDDARREKLYAGDVFVYSPTSASKALCEFARQLLREAFGSLDPERAQYEMPVEQFARVLAEVKPKFIHHDESKRLIRALLRELGCDEQETYFDVPRMRSSTSDGYLTTGIAYAFHPHRDTWYSAPMCQINWWMPIYDVEGGNVMAFHPQYWSKPVRNGSASYDYQRWNATSRYIAAQQIGKDTREQPRPLDPIDTSNDIRVVTPVGGVMLFSAAQLHSSVPNNTGRTRYSIDFRVINLRDAQENRGAPNVDSYCTGTAMCDFLRLKDLQHVPQELIDRYMPGHPQKPLAPAA